ncbi:hypothetical protein [Bosea sp. (in: a-proteobacteria)]|uniref:hypothetical protein n=1 Tax=Bosea sp. (in: a-proteobacteria) TaxID=1871050 RepID=UPI0026173028|nr:hypothetical protein [Bosea sp. (in: a-proteobacteria)]MCO5091511.1 hypothetical protein [Bosea sp. (in: a-proteobacteria)]
MALSVLMASQDANAQGLVITRQYYAGGSTTVLQRLRGTGHVTQLQDGAPGNNCPIPSFEIVNPRQGEARCVGYVAPSWLER